MHAHTAPPGRTGLLKRGQEESDRVRVRVPLESDPADHHGKLVTPELRKDPEFQCVISVLLMFC